VNTPILVIAFNRPETLRVLLQALRAQNCQNVYFAVDGPRTQRPDDAPKVGQVKELIDEVFAPSAERCLYQGTNLGIRKGPPAAITWFFSQVEEGIILEDDCIPGEGFFPFVNWALNEYRSEDRVKVISGFNRFSPQSWPESFRFVKTAMIWGWASWRRAWKDYDPEMRSWDDPQVRRKFRRWAGSFPVYDFWRESIHCVQSGRLVTWDVAWCWTVFQQEGLGVFPRVSLIQNIGFGDDATNTGGGDERALVRAGVLSTPYLAPSQLAPDRALQRALDRKEFWRTALTLGGRLKRLAQRVKRKWYDRQP
jgi:hypothetical protein